MQTTVATWGALVIALVGGAVVLVAVARLRAIVTFRLDRAVAFGAIVCAAALSVALLSNRYRVVRERFGALFLGLNSITHPLDAAVVFTHGVIVLVAVAGGALVAGTLGRCRAASMLLFSAAFGALLVDPNGIRSVGPYFEYLPAFGLLLAGAAGASLLACWCWVGDRQASTAPGLSSAVAR
jgi:hypothetical protein